MLEKEFSDAMNRLNKILLKAFEDIISISIEDREDNNKTCKIKTKNADYYFFYYPNKGWKYDGWGRSLNQD